MKRVFPVIFSVAFAVANLGCGGTSATNNNSNVNSAAPPAANQNTNGTVAVQDEPVPTFDDAQTAFAAGEKYLDANKVEKSIEAYKQAVKLNSDFAEAYFKLGIAYALIEDTKETIPGDGPTTGSKPTKKNPVKKGGKIVKPESEKTDSEKAFEAAAKAYEKILDKNPKDDLAQYNLGRAYNKLNQDEDAEKALRQAVKLKPDDSEYQAELGKILIKLAKYDEAIKALKKALSIEPDNSQFQDFLEKAEAGKKRIDFGKEENKDNLDNRSVKDGSGKPTETPIPRDKREPQPTIEGGTPIKKP